MKTNVSEMNKQMLRNEIGFLKSQIQILPILAKVANATDRAAFGVVIRESMMKLRKIMWERQAEVLMLTIKR